MPITEEGILERIRSKDETIARVPIIDWPISVNKIHAIQYGIGMGLIGGVWGSIRPTDAVLLTVGLFLLAFGISPLRSIRIGCRYNAEKATIFVLTVQHKPHYFILPYLAIMLPCWAIASILL